MFQYATDYKMVAVGNDTNGTILYQKVQTATHTHTLKHTLVPNVARLKGKVLPSVICMSQSVITHTLKQVVKSLWSPGLL